MKLSLDRILILLAAILLLVVHFRFPAYIGYYIMVLAVPYGLYGMVKPYKSALAHAKKGQARAYSVQQGSLIIALGGAGYFYSAMTLRMQATKGFLIGLMIYMIFVFLGMYWLNKRYMEP